MIDASSRDGYSCRSPGQGVKTSWALSAPADRHQLARIVHAPTPRCKLGALAVVDPRTFRCRQCHAVVFICSQYDRGQAYCGPSCSSGARRARMRGAGRRHARTEAGRRGAARCQRESRHRRRMRADACFQCVAFTSSPGRLDGRSQSIEVLLQSDWNIALASVVQQHLEEVERAVHAPLLRPKRA